MAHGITKGGHAAPHLAAIGKQAVIVGAGIAGPAAAGALADWFEHVIVLERDRLPDVAEPRAGTPQSWHTHGLLVGGQMALEKLVPNIGADLVRAGGVPVRINQDLREEFPNREPMPQRDFGLIGYTMTRPLIETALRRRVLQRSNVALRGNIRALGIIAARDGQRAAGARCMSAEDDEDEIIPADLVIDASGRRRDAARDA